MAAKRRGPQPQMKGFRPGKEPAHLKKKHAKAQLGADAPWAQKQAVDLVAGRSPTEVKAMVKKWTLGLFAAAGVIGIGGFFLYGVWLPAGIAAHVVTVGLLLVAYRMTKSGKNLVELAGSL